MPRILEETEITFDRADLSRRSPISRPVVPAPRSSGIHISGVLRYIAKVSGLAKVLDELDQEEMPTRWIGGIMWEEFAASMYPEMVWQPGEICLDDVWMTCDGLTHVENVADSDIMVEEFKCTEKKVRTGTEFLKEWLYIHQGGSYCAAYGVYLVRYHIYYVMGYYRGKGPVYMRYLVEFSHSEIGQIRRMIQANKSKATAEKNTAEVNT